MTKLTELSTEELDSITGANAITALANAIVDGITAGVNALASAGGTGQVVGAGAVGGAGKSLGAPKTTWY